MSILVDLYGLVLLGYTAWRTWDFLTMNLPSEMAGEMALLGLFALDVGLILWHMYYRKGAKSKMQSEVSITLTVADFIGSFAAGTADMILRQTMIEGLVVPPLLASILIYGIPLIVAMNVAGALIAAMNDPEEAEKRALRITSNAIRMSAIGKLNDSRDALANESATEIFAELKEQAKATARSLYTLPSIQVIDGNGKANDGKQDETIAINSRVFQDETENFLNPTTAKGQKIE